MEKLPKYIIRKPQSFQNHSQQDGELRVNIETTKENALSLLGLLSIVEKDYKRTDNTQILDLIKEHKEEILDGLIKYESNGGE